MKIWKILLAVLIFALVFSAIVASASAQPPTVQQLQDEIAQLNAQLQQLQTSSGSVTGITQPSQGGSINYPNKITLSWNANNSSWGGIESGNASVNIGTVYELQYGSWNFNGPDVSGYWNAQYNFGGVETSNTAALTNESIFGSNGNMNMGGLHVGEGSWAYSDPSYSGSNVWTSLSASLNASSSLILSSNVSLNDYPDYGNPSIIDFSGNLWVSGELYSGIPVNPQEPMEIQGIQSEISYLQAEVNAQSVPEPSMWALLMAAIGGLLKWRRRFA